MRILLTGVSGFIGSAVAGLALERGHSVAGLTRSALPPAPAGSPGVTWLQGSLADAPWADIAAFAPDLCVHAAWLDDAGSGYEAPENDDYLRWSRDFLVRLLAMGVPRLLALGTCAEYRPDVANLTEDVTPLAPASRYARAKDALHLVVRDAVARTPGAVLCWARPFYVYGAGEPPRKLCSALVRQLSRGEEVVLRTPHSTKDYIHVRDVAAALLRAAEAGFHGALNVGTGEGVTVAHLARTVCRRLGRPEDLVRLPADAPSADCDRTVADVARLRRLDWSPTCSLEAGLDEIISWHSRPGV